MIKLLHNMINPETGNTYKQDNLEKWHNIPLGSLVEIVPVNENDDFPTNGVRLHVVGHTRDCDGTPLYSLGIWDESGHMDGVVAIIDRDSGYPPRFKGIFHGYGEESLRVIHERN